MLIRGRDSAARRAGAVHVGPVLDATMHPTGRQMLILDAGIPHPGRYSLFSDAEKRTSDSEKLLSDSEKSISASGVRTSDAGKLLLDAEKLTLDSEELILDAEAFILASERSFSESEMSFLASRTLGSRPSRSSSPAEEMKECR